MPADPSAALFAAVAETCRRLEASADRIAPSHREAGESLAAWIARKTRDGAPAEVVVVCTGNSRRSVLGATLGNVAAGFVPGHPVRFTSGGTSPTAVNPRTAAALLALGLVVEPTGHDAPRGQPDLPNPIQEIRWGPGASAAREFSKRFDDPSNPADGFAALLVCDEADAACPTVPGAAIRIPMPFVDPKFADGTVREPQQYIESAEAIGRVMLWTLRRARELGRPGTSSTPSQQDPSRCRKP